MDKPISSYILKLTGKAELPRAIDMGHNYHISLEGAISGRSDNDMEDGTMGRTYTFKAIKVELLDPLGETLKLKDTRSKSQILRARFWSIWKEQNINMAFDEWYDKLMDNMREGAVEITEMYGPTGT